MICDAMELVAAIDWTEPSVFASLAAAAVFGVCFLGCRIVSLSSMLAAVAFAVCRVWRLMPEPFSVENRSLAAFSLLLPLLIIVRHRSNLARLLKGEEPRFGTGVSKDTPEGP